MAQRDAAESQECSKKKKSFVRVSKKISMGGRCLGERDRLVQNLQGDYWRFSSEAAYLPLTFIIWSASPFDKSCFILLALYTVVSR